MERDHRYSVGPPRRRRDARGDRQGALAAHDVSHRSRDDRHRYAGDVAAAAQPRFHRSEGLYRQAMDEARHAEVFRKRALTTGWGLMAASPMNEMALKHLRDADSFSEMSVALHLVAEGNVLTMFRFSEYLSPTDVDKKIFRLVMQDEARHVGYGMQHFKYVLEHFPEKREVLHAHLDEAENISFAGAAATELTESFIILAGGGLKKENIQKGVKVTSQFQLKQMEEHFERLDKCGMPERKNPDRSKLYKMFEMGRAAAAQ